MGVKLSTKTVVSTLAATDRIPVNVNMSTAPTLDNVEYGTLKDAILGARTGTDGGTANARTLTVSPAVTALTTGMKFTIKSSVANTGATTLAVSGLTPVAIKKNIADALAGGEIPLGAMYEVIYDGTNFQLMKNA